MSDKLRDAAANAIETFGEAGRRALAAALMGGAAIILVRALTAPWGARREFRSTIITPRACPTRPATPIAASTVPDGTAMPWFAMVAARRWILANGQGRQAVVCYGRGNSSPDPWFNMVATEASDRQ